MSFFVFANNVSTRLASNVSPSDTVLNLISTAGLNLPAGGRIPLTLSDLATSGFFEVVYITAISNDSVTVIRGQDGTAALAWSTGDYAYSTNTRDTTAATTGNPLNPFQVAPASNPNQAISLGQLPSQFPNLLAPSGYQRLPGGLIVQWGSSTAINASPTPVLFSISFPNNCFSVAFSTNLTRTDNVQPFWITTAINNNGFSWTRNTGAQSWNMRYIAVGN